VSAISGPYGSKQYSAGTDSLLYCYEKYYLLFISCFFIFFGYEKVSANTLDSTQYFEQKIPDFYAKKIATLTVEDAAMAKETLGKIDSSAMEEKNFLNRKEICMEEMWIFY
jgi:hypothetical protein